MNRLNVILIEDDEVVRVLLRKILEKYDCDIIEESDNGEDITKKIKDIIPDFIIIDINLKGDLDGFETAKKISSICSVPIVFTSAINYVDYENIINKISIPNKIYFIDKSSFKEKIIKIINQIKMEKN